MIRIRKAGRKWVNGMMSAIACIQRGIWLRGQVKPDRIKLGVATTIRISVALS
ncbi:hypothetical protein D3C80_1914510 [compost metagenome]